MGMENLLYSRMGKCIIVNWEMLERGHIRSCFFWVQIIKILNFHDKLFGYIYCSAIYIQTHGKTILQPQNNCCQKSSHQTAN